MVGEKKLEFLINQVLGKLPTTVGLDTHSAESFAGVVTGLVNALDEEEEKETLKIIEGKTLKSIKK